MVRTIDVDPYGQWFATYVIDTKFSYLKACLRRGGRHRASVGSSYRP